jgi:hypothetical protein
MHITDLLHDSLYCQMSNWHVSRKWKMVTSRRPTIQTPVRSSSWTKSSILSSLLSLWMILLETRLYRFFFDRTKPSNMSSTTFEGGAACYKCKNIQGAWELVVLICILVPKTTSASTNLGLQTSRTYHIIHPWQWWDSKKFQYRVPINQISICQDSKPQFESK